MNQINCYTDASYSNKKNIAVVAYKINDLPIQILTFAGYKNTQAELAGIVHCINFCSVNYVDIKQINIYTDCQNAWKQDYTELTMNKFTINLIKIKGHQKIANMKTPEDLIFKSVDKMARKVLRSL